jgi:glycosyltransferase involved in cell wall biosynthesis
MAATSRVKMLAKGLIENKYYVRYIGLRGAKTRPDKDKVRKGSSDNVDYHYPGIFVTRSKSWLLRRIDDVTAKWLAFIHIVYLKRKGKVDVAILYTRNPGVLFFWTKKLQYLKIPVILELCEWPLANIQSNGNGVAKARKFCFDGISIVDGVLPISAYIEEEVKQIGRSTGRIIPSFKIPILVDSTAYYEPSTGNGFHYPYLLYSGSIKYMDIARFVVEVMATLKRKNVDVRMIFTGGGKPREYDKLRDYASQRNVINDIEFTGYVEEPELISLMKNAVALLAPLPDDLQSKARFPTKIGYYLSSGRPVITTPYGEVSKYLKDGENAYLARRFSSDEVADKVCQVLAKPERANRIGFLGAQTALKYFNYTSAMNGIHEFILHCKRKYNKT